MPTHNFVIIGPDSPEGEIQYWSNSLEDWTTIFDKCTTFNKDILLAPYPLGAYGYLELSNDEVICEYAIEENGSVTKIIV